jgi:SSS family solute:Na+ symporter
MGTFIIVAVVVLLLGLSVAVGFAAAWGRQHVSEDYFLASRSLPWFVVALAMIGPTMRLDLWLGMIGLTYMSGIVAGSLGWSLFLAVAALAWVVLPYMARKRLFSPAEYFERRYSRSARGTYAVLTIAMLFFGVLLPAIYMGGWVLDEAVGGVQHLPDTVPWTFFVCVALVAVASAAGVYGGLAAGAWSGAVQTLIVLVGGTVFSVAAVVQSGGLRSLMSQNGPGRLTLLLPQSAQNDLLPWMGVLALFFTWALWTVAASPLGLQRCLGACSEWDARLGSIVGGLLQIVVTLLFVLPGLAAWTKLGSHTDVVTAERSALHMLEITFGHSGIVPSLGQGVVSAGLFAAVLASISAALNGIATLWTMDITQDLLGRTASEADLVKRGRRATLMALLLGALLAPLLLGWEHSIIEFALETASLAGPPIAVVLIVGFFWPQAHGRAAATTMVLGSMVGAATWFIASNSDVAPEWMKPVTDRAGLTALASLLLLALTTFALPQGQEFYDPDTAWSRQKAAVPDAPPGIFANLGLWTGALLVAAAAVWIVRR